MTISAFRLAALSTALVASLASAMPATGTASRGPTLVAFDGAEELGNTAARLGIMTQMMEFNVAVGADGVPTGCTMTRKFRSATVPRQLCDVVVREARFAPAVDAAGNPASGTYRGQIGFRSVITREQ
jgi:hypothetical protein